MATARPSAFSNLRMGGKSSQTSTTSPSCVIVARVQLHRTSRQLLLFLANVVILLTEVIREKVQDGLTGETKEMQYTQCKVIGNGSFGVVFQTKLSPSGEDAAIKRVLQDKRFKVWRPNGFFHRHVVLRAALSARHIVRVPEFMSS